MIAHGTDGFHRTTGPVCSRRGVATVETAIILPLLLVILFGTLEVGLMAKTTQSVHHTAREAVRVASIGATVSRIHSQIAATAPNLNLDNLDTTLEYRTWDETAGAWGPWTTLSDDGTQNTAISGDQIRVRLRYTHKLATGDMFGLAAASSNDNTVPLNATIVSMRE